MDAENVEKIVQQLSEKTEKHQEVIMNIAQRLQDKGVKAGWEKGHQQGLEEGIEKGKHEANLAIARTLLKNGISLELIMESTGLSQEELISLQWCDRCPVLLMWRALFFLCILQNHHNTAYWYINGLSYVR
nr:MULTISPECIES: hypothetical protein [Providencia]